MRLFLLLFATTLTAAVTAQDFETTTALFGDLQVRQIGPALMSGRVTCIATDPEDTNIVYIGSGGGGIWKTLNGGSSVEPIFDDHPQSIGAIAVAPSDGKVIYAGTGEGWPRNSVSIGDGIYKSTDGGRRWTHLGLDSTERIAAIAVHPENADVAYVAALGPLWSDGEQRGVFKTTDGGQTWSCILYLSPSTGAAELSMDPSDPDVLFAAMWDHRRTPHSFDSGYGGKSGLFRTTDGGHNWERIEQGLPAEKLGRIAVAIAPSNPKTVYASVETGTSETKGMYRSDDGGDTWQLVDRSKNNQIRPFYFAEITVDPSNDSIVAKCGYSGIISEDAGNTWRDFDGSVHADHHAIWINPEDGRHILIGTDGGVYESRDRGYTFKMWQNLPLSQFYRVSVDNAEPYNIYGGMQDNGSWYGPSRSAGGITNADWKGTFGGDGFYSFRHPTKSHYIFSEAQEGVLVRYDERVGRSKMIAPYKETGGEDLRFNWNAPIHLSADGERLYFASQFLFRSGDEGDSWERISPDLTTNDTAYQQQYRSGGLSIDNSGAENHTTIYAVAESPLDPNTIWVGTDDGNLQMTTDGGATWTEVGHNIPGQADGRHWVSFVEASPHDASTAFVTLDGHRTGDMTPYLYRTTDAGESWQRLQDDDIEGYALSVRQDPINSDLLFLGTEFGLYISLDGGRSWAPFRNGIPKVGIRDMVIHSTAGDLVLGTHGRGVIILDDLEALRQITPELVGGDITFLDIPTNYFYDGRGGGAGAQSGSGVFTGPNPSTATRIMYYAPKRHTFGKMYVEIYRDTQLVRTLQAGKAAGLNLVSLPITTDKPKSAPTDNTQALGGTIFGPTLPAGEYRVKLIKGKNAYETTFELAVDPDSPYGAEERAAQYKLATALYADVEELAYLYEVVDQIEQQSEMDQEDHPKLQNIHDASAREKARLAFSGGDGYVDQGEALAEELSSLYGAVSGFPGRPSESQVREAERLHEELIKARERVEEIMRRASELNGEVGEDRRLRWPDRESFFASS